MSELKSEVIGGRSLRSRKSLAAKNKGKNKFSVNTYKFIKNIRESNDAD